MRASAVLGERFSSYITNCVINRSRMKFEVGEDDVG